MGTEGSPKFVFSESQSPLTSQQNQIVEKEKSSFFGFLSSRGKLLQKFS